MAFSNGTKLHNGSMILVLVASLVAAENSSKPKSCPRLACEEDVRAKIPKRFLQPELSPEQVEELTQTRDKLTAETKQWPRALKFDLMMRIGQKREELALLEHQLNECERAVGSEKTTSVQHQGATFKFCEPHVETVGLLEQMLCKIRGFDFYTKPEASGTSRFETRKFHEEIRKFHLESSNFRYNIHPSAPPTPFAFTAVYNHVINRLAKIHYIQKILDDHALAMEYGRSFDSYLNGGGGVSYSTQESVWESLLHGAMVSSHFGDFGPVFKNAFLDSHADSHAILRYRIVHALRDLPKVLAV